MVFNMATELLSLTPSTNSTMLTICTLQTCLQTKYTFLRFKVRLWTVKSISKCVVHNLGVKLNRPIHIDESDFGPQSVYFYDPLHWPFKSCAKKTMLFNITLNLTLTLCLCEYKLFFLWKVKRSLVVSGDIQLRNRWSFGRLTILHICIHMNWSSCHFRNGALKQLLVINHANKFAFVGNPSFLECKIFIK